MKIAITAVSGQLGRAIAHLAIDEFGKENIIGIARSPEKASDMGIEIRKGDYNSKNDFMDALFDIDELVLISGMDHPEKRVTQHRNIIEAARENEVDRIIYSSIFGEIGKCSFDAIIRSNRQTEADIIQSGMEWIIGRNGLYIDADFESIPEYTKTGFVVNSAGKGKCGYTSREELAFAYVNMMHPDSPGAKVYNLCGPAYSQKELCQTLNDVFDLDLKYKALSSEEYLKDRIESHGEFLGSVIAGIYDGIREGAFKITPDFMEIAERPHKSLKEMAVDFKNAND